MELRSLNRYQAFSWHFLFSALLGLAVYLLFRFVWYPGALWDLSGAGKLLLLVVGVDVTIGPLLTLIVFNPKKKSLPLDLVTIALVQTTALGYGLWIMAQSRPVFLVAVVDRIVIVSANEVDPASLDKAKPEFAHMSWTGPVLVGAVPARDGDGGFEIAMQALSGGADIDRLADHYVPFTQVAAAIADRGLTPATIKARESEPKVAALIARLGDQPLAPTARAVMLRGRTGFGTAIIDSERVVATVDQDIW